jgi:hypothetical protein
MRRKLTATAVLLASATLVFALSGVPLRTMWMNPDNYGVGSDANVFYENGVSKVQNYFGTGGGNVVLVTYSTGRKLTFQFDPTSASWQASHLPQTVAAEVDLYGINFYGPFQSMAVGTTAQLQTTLQFKVGGNTYELWYPSLAAMRTGTNTWLITSDPNDIPGFPGFTASSSANLSVFRKRSRTTFGSVSMPIRFEVNLK